MIRKTLARTKSATFSLLLPNVSLHGMPTPTGTGFFVSPDGFFVTAAHVITENGRPDGQPRRDISQAWLQKEVVLEDATLGEGSMGCQFASLESVDPVTDFALLSIDFEKNAEKDWLKGKKTGFPYIQVSSSELEEGEPVYSFGYPLPDSTVTELHPGIFVGHSSLRPRITSAIVSSKTVESGTIVTDKDPKRYVLDKALNYGNSGGPVVSTATGHAHAFCSWFQPVYIPQDHLREGDKPIAIKIPSLYGVVSSLGDFRILEKLRAVGVPIVEE